MEHSSTGTLVQRAIARVVTTPPPQPGFIGEGHTAVTVVDPANFAVNDPFILLMDDRVNLQPGRGAGEAHPHAGFEISTFVVEGELRDRDEGVLRAGDLMWMNAGSGVIHNEDSEPLGKTRVLQLWVKLPSAERRTAPRFQHVPRDMAPVRREPGVEARIYVGSSGDAKATTRTHIPITIADVHLEAGASFEHELPPKYRGFLYLLEGFITAGRDHRKIGAEQVGWLDNEDDASTLRIVAGARGARVMLYVGERQDVPIVLHGPFVGESREELKRISRDYVSGRMPRVSELRATEP